MSENDIIFHEVQIVSVTSKDKHNKQEEEDFTETKITFMVTDEPLESIDRIREARQMGFTVKATFEIVK